MPTIHVWTFGQNTAPYATKISAARRIGTAVAAARAGDTIIVHGDWQPNARCVYREHVAAPAATTPLTFQGEDWPIVDGWNAGSCFSIESGSALVTIAGFEIRNGRATIGGGISAVGANLTVRQNCIHHNAATKRGGGIAAGQGDETPAPQVLIEGNHVQHNTASEWGGGVALISDEYDPGPRTVTLRANIVGPQNRSNKGAGVMVVRGNVLVEDNLIHNNRAWSGPKAARGGGIEVRDRDEGTVGTLATLVGAGFRNPEQAVLRHNHIHHNQSEEDGGGVAAEWGGTIVLQQNTIEHNWSQQDGGGCYASVMAKLEFRAGNAVQHNVANDEEGGGIHATCKARLEFADDNLVAGNRAPNGSGGGISVREAELVATNGLHVEGNTAGGHGGGIYALTDDFPWSTPHFFPCEGDTLVDLDGVAVEGNTSGREGAGIAIIKAHAFFLRSPSRIANSVIRSNRSTHAATAGIYVAVTTGFVFPFQVRVTGCLLEDHPGTRARALHVEAVHAPFTMRNAAVRVADCTFRRNDIGVVLMGVEADVSRSIFRGQVVIDIATSDVDWTVSGCELDGGGTTAYGIFAFAPVTGNVTRCDIHDHYKYGYGKNLRNAVMFARGNWWGHPAGPTVPGGPVNGDRIAPRVQWPPLRNVAYAWTAPFAPGVMVFTPVPPPTPEFSMQSEFYGELRCGEST